MTIVMPHDVVDTEVYVQDHPRTYRNPDGSMDVIHLEKNVELSPTP